MEFEFLAPCHFGLESVLKREITDLGYEITKVDNGKVYYKGDENAICRSNIFLRTTERVLLNVATFKATTFDELFERTKAIPWEEYLPKNAKFWVTKATSVSSELFSPSDIQSIMKKAIVERLKTIYNISWFPEDGDEYPIRVNILKDEVVVSLDTTGESLHKRGYRKYASKAPITETLAAALIMLTPWNKDRILVDPFCGSGTFPIEAALLGCNIAPGMNREFTAENWTNILPKKSWYRAIEEAHDMIIRPTDMDIQGYDIDGDIVKAAMENAKLAEVDEYIHFQQRPVSELSHRKKYGFIITNPPYGERIEDEDSLPGIYKDMGNAFKSLDSWSYFIITNFEDLEKYIGRKANRNRKVYNGMIKTYFYQFMGPRPPRRS